MGILYKVIGIGAAISLQLVIGLTCIEIIAFRVPYYEKQYIKNQVFQAVEMEPEELLWVTEEMLLYLKDERDTLDMIATVGENQREFFNQREKQHMEDVKYLFIKAYQLRKVSIILFFSCVVFLVYRRIKWLHVLLKGIQWTTGILLGFIILLSAIIAINFTKAFTIFHEIFFSNDLWLLDYETDWLIRMVPESFFVDISVKIGSFILIVLFLQWIGTSFYSRHLNMKEKI